MDEIKISKYNIKNFNIISDNEKYIFYLIKTGNIRLLDYYLSTRPKSIYEIDEDGNTPLFYAIYKNDYKLVKLCIQYKSDVNIHNNQGISPLVLSFNNIDTNDGLNIIKILIKYNANVDETINNIPLIIYAMKFNNTNAIFELLNSNINVDQHTLNKWTPLFYTITELNNTNNIIRNTNLIFAELLINHNADLNVLDVNNKTMLSYALLKNNIDIVKLLVKHNVNTDIYYDDINTPLFYALHHNDVNLVKLLIKYNVNVDRMNKNKELPIIYVIKHNQIKILKLLLKAHCYLPKTIEEIPTIMYSMKYCNSEISVLLIEAGINIKYTDKFNNNLAHYAVKFNKPKIVAALYEHYININQLNIQSKSIVEYIGNNLKGYNILTILINNDIKYEYVKKYLYSRYIFSYNMNFILLIVSKMKVNFYVKRYKYKKYDNLTILHATAFNKNSDVLMYFLNNNISNKNKIDINDDNNTEKLTPLNCAVLSNNLKNINTLIIKGADMNHKNNNNEDIIKFAEKNKCNIKTIEFLKHLKIEKELEEKENNYLQQNNLIKVNDNKKKHKENEKILKKYKKKIFNKNINNNKIKNEENNQENKTENNKVNKTIKLNQENKIIINQENKIENNKVNETENNKMNETKINYENNKVNETKNNKVNETENNKMNETEINHENKTIKLNQEIENKIGKKQQQFNINLLENIDITTDNNSLNNSLNNGLNNNIQNNNQINQENESNFKDDFNNDILIKSNK